MLLNSLEVQQELKLDYCGAGVIISDGSGNITSDGTNFSSGSYTPTFTNQSGVTSIVALQSLYSKNGSVVTMSISMQITNGLLSSAFDVSLPVAKSSNFSNINEFNCTVVSYNNGLTSVTTNPVISSNTGAQTFHVLFPSLSLGTYIIRITAQYAI